MSFMILRNGENQLKWPYWTTLPGPVLELLESKQLLIPGEGCDANHSHQFVEGEYMLPNEYDAFLRDPSDFAVRVIAPRVLGSMKALEKLPPLHTLINGAGPAANIAELVTQPEFIEFARKLVKAGEARLQWQKVVGDFEKEMETAGYPTYSQGGAGAPFDRISDYLRGMKGSMLDMYRQPDNLLAACDKIYNTMFEPYIPAPRKNGGMTRIFMALHRGAEGFMSRKQFEKFYWPGLKKVMLALIDHGLTPCPFIEGEFTNRLEYLLELPKGKVVARLDTTNIFKAKEILGNHMCIEGNMPVSIMQTGTPREVRDYAKKLIDVVGKDGGYIMGARSSIDEVDPKLLKVWVDFTKESGVYK
jgi:uroporphyrinogen-III decarboxylase